MNQPFLERRGPLGISLAMLLLFGFFFVQPIAFQSARLAVQEKTNDVKDWLPSSFAETAELEWFAKHFAGESFVLATWPGCTTDDQRLALLEQKLLHESLQGVQSRGSVGGQDETVVRARQVGQELQLLIPGDDFYNWGGQREKWFASGSGQWYYILPNGHLYRWEGGVNLPQATIRAIKKSTGTLELEGQFVTAFGSGADDPSETNPIHNDPSLLCAPLFHTVETGESMVKRLTREGGPLWPIDMTDPSQREKVARRRAMRRLTGTLFAPAVPRDFDWSAQSFRDAMPDSRLGQLPEDFDELIQYAVQSVVDDQFAGDLAQLKTATTDQQEVAWYAIFDAVDVVPPARLTCLLVTLTDLAKDNLAYAVGRGVMGGPRGRLLTLAEESGIQPAPPPSAAPPPFNTRFDETASTMPPLRLGGPPVDNIAIDEEGTITLVRLVGYSVFIGVVLSYLCFRSIKVTIMVFIVGGSSAIVSMAMVGWTSGSVDAVLMSMPSLVYVLGLSGAIHVINYYRDECRLKGVRGAAGRAFRHAFLPCALASLTTAIGLASLVSSNLAPINNFGFYSALGVLSTIAILFVYLPAALHVFAPVIGVGRNVESTATDQSDSPKSKSELPRATESRLSELWAGVGRWITRRHGWVAFGCLLFLIGITMGLRHIETSVQLLKLFDSDARIIRDYAWLEDNFGKLVPMEVVLRVPKEMQRGILSEDGEASETDPSSTETQLVSLNMLKRVEAVARISKVVQRTLGEEGRGVVGRSMSADTFLPPLPGPSNGNSVTRIKFRRDLNTGREELLQSDYLTIEESGPFEGSELWRISLRVAALSDVDYGQFISTLRDAVQPILNGYQTRADILKALASLDGRPGERVGVVGSKRPLDLSQADLLNEDGSLNAQATYLSTLHELLSSEKIKKPWWYSPTIEQAEKAIGNPAWDKKLAEFDTIVWVGGEGLTEAHFANVKHLIDARQAADHVSTSQLLPGRIPTVDDSNPLQVVYTGVVPVVYKAQRTLLTSLVESIGSAFILIAAVMIVLLNPGRSVTQFLKPSNMGNGLAAGVVSMIPNVFPVLVVFGAMGHLNAQSPGDFLIDIGTMMTASVAMGVAVDDTIHFLAWFRDYLDKGLSRIEAVIETYRRVGPAMTQTTIVGGLGLFIFSLSTFTPTQRFGTFMLILLATALVGDLVFLPALLAGPLGRFFKPRVGAALPAGVPVEPVQAGSEDEDPEDDSPEPPSLKLHVPPPRADSEPPLVKRR